MSETSYVRQVLSGSTDGRPIKVAATATAGTLLHTAVNVAGATDEVWLWAINTSAATVTLTVEFGGVTSPDDHIVIELAPRRGVVPVVPGVSIQTGVVVRAFASSANVINIVGNVNRVEPT